MSRSAAVLLLAALVTPASCFQYTPKDCQVLCPLTPDGACPGQMQCQAQAGLPPHVGICAAQNTICPPIADSGVISVDSGTRDASDAGDAGPSQPPSMLCHNTTCFTLPDSIRSKLVLLLWPSNLPQTVGSTVSLWADQSGQGNDAHALDPGALPTVIPDGVHLDSAQLGTGFVVLNSPSLDFGSSDFAVIIVSGLSSGDSFVGLFSKSDGARTNSRQVAINWVVSAPLTGRPEGKVDDTPILATMDLAQPSVTAYSLYRSNNHVQLFVNAAVVGSADLPTPDYSTTGPDNLYLGVTGMTGTPVDSIEAVIAVRGSIGSTDLNDLQTFLRSVFAKPAP